MTKTSDLNLWQRIHAVMSEISYLQKENKSGMRYSIVSHDKVTALVRPVFVKHGVIFYPVEIMTRQDGNRTEAKLTVRFVNIDAPEEFIDVASLGYGVDPQDKGPGKAISYGVKYAVLKTLALETGDDPDNHQGAEANHKREFNNPNMTEETKAERRSTAPAADGWD